MKGETHAFRLVIFNTFYVMVLIRELIKCCGTRKYIIFFASLTKIDESRSKINAVLCFTSWNFRDSFLYKDNWTGKIYTCFSKKSKTMQIVLLLIHACGNNLSMWKGTINCKLKIIRTCWEGGRWMGLGVYREVQCILKNTWPTKIW